MKNQQSVKLSSAASDFGESSAPMGSKMSLVDVPDITETSFSPDEDGDVDFVMSSSEKKTEAKTPGRLDNDARRRVILQHMALKAASNATRTAATASTTVARAASTAKPSSLWVELGILLANVLVGLVLLGSIMKLVDLVFRQDYFDSLGLPAGSLPVGFVLVGCLAVGAVYVSDSTVGETKRKIL